MKQYVYPIVLYRDEETESYMVAFNDLNLFAEGESVEEAFLNAKELLNSFLECVKEFDDEVEDATEYKLVKEKNNKNIVLLVGCQDK